MDCSVFLQEIFEKAGVPVQETILGTYKTKKGVEKIVVACKDFTSVGIELQDFASLKNQIIDSERNGYGTELADILSVFDEQTAMEPEKIRERFWDMFIVDAFIGNWDRHNGNWVFLYHVQSDELTLAPVFDCGSCLYPQADERMIMKILADKQEINNVSIHMQEEYNFMVISDILTNSQTPPNLKNRFGG